MAKQKANQEEGAEAASSFSPKEKAEYFFLENPGYPNDFVYVCSDGTIFHGNLKGKNNAENYCKANNGITFETVNR